VQKDSQDLSSRVNNFEELEDDEKIKALRDVLKSNSDDRMEHIESLNNSMTEELFIELVLSVAEEFNEENVLDYQVSREDVENFLIADMNIFRWEKVEDSEAVFKRFICMTLLKHAEYIFSPSDYDGPSNAYTYQNDELFSKPPDGWIDFFVSYSEGFLDASRLDSEISKDRDKVTLNYNGQEDLKREFSSVHNLRVEVRKFLNQVLEYEDSEYRIYRLKPKVASKSQGRTATYTMFLFCTKEKVDYINQYLNYQK